MKGCKNRGYKTAGIIDEAVLRAVAAEIFSERFGRSSRSCETFFSQTSGWRRLCSKNLSETS
jgi:hypothetical protein